MPKWTYVVLAVALFLLARYFYFKPNYVYGESLPELNIELIDGTEFSKEDMDGKLVLIDFWGSWCGPCRKEAPDLVRLYKDYHGRAYKDASDFEILSIAIESDERRWKSAIEEDGLDWPWHYSSLDKFGDPLSREFGVRQIPTKFLIDGDGMVIGLNPDFEKIRSILDQRLIN